MSPSIGSGTAQDTKKRPREEHSRPAHDLFIHNELCWWRRRESNPIHRECIRIEDVIDTTDLDPGNFSYHLRSVDSATDQEIANLDLHVTFTVKPILSEPN